MAFRASDEEARELDALVALGGLSKQDYIMRRLLCRDVVVVPSSRVLRALEDISREVLGELRRLDDAREVPLERGRPWACWRARWRGWEARRRPPRLR